MPSPPILAPQILRYPLIPAPLGAVPSPIIPQIIKEKRRTSSRDYAIPVYQHPQHHQLQGKVKKSPSRSREPSITTEDVAKTYTGLDRVIAEEFIEICDSRNNSLCSESSCQSCNKSDECQCESNNSSKSSLSDTTFKHYKQ